LPAEGLALEGHELHAVEVGHSDGDASTVLHVPALHLVVAGDDAYNNVHQYLADGGIDAVRALRPPPWWPGTRTRTARVLRRDGATLPGPPSSIW
jgi:hypothetical protein